MSDKKDTTDTTDEKQNEKVETGDVSHKKSNDTSESSAPGFFSLKITRQQIGLLIILFIFGAGLAVIWSMREGGSLNTTTIRSNSSNSNTVETNEPLTVETDKNDAVLNDVVKPFYQARLDGDDATARSFLIDYFSDPQAGEYTADFDWPMLLSGGQVIIRQAFQGEQVNLSGNDAYDQTQIDRYVATITHNNVTFEEILNVNTRSQINGPDKIVQITSVDYHREISRFVYDDLDQAYRVLKTAENRPDGSPEVIVGLADALDSCGAYSGTYKHCTFLKNSDGQSNEGWQIIAQNEGKDYIGINSFLSYSIEDSNKVLYQSGFGDAGLSNDHIYAIDIYSGESNEVISVFSLYHAGDIYVDDVASVDWPSIVIDACSKLDAEQIEGVEYVVSKASRTLNLYECHGVIDYSVDDPPARPGLAMALENGLLLEQAEGTVDKAKNGGVVVDILANIYGEGFVFSLFDQQFSL